MRTDQELKECYSLVYNHPQKMITLTFKSAATSIQESNRMLEIIGKNVNDDVKKFEARGINIENYKLLVDFTLLPKAPYVDYGTTKKTMDLLKGGSLDKIAAVSKVAGTLKVATNFIMKTTGKSDQFKWFDDMDKAIAWLNE